MIEFDGTTSLDQAETPNKYDEFYVLDLADRLIGESLELGDFDIAWQGLEKYRALNKASSLGICKILHGVKSNWDKVSHEEETFVQEAMRRTGYSQLSIERYVNIWEMLTGEYIPEEFKEGVQGQTIRQLVKVAETVVDQGYGLEHDDWQAISDAVDYNATMDVCQKAKGKERNKNHLSLKITEIGDIVAYQGQDERQVGRLFVLDDDPIVQKSVRRIMRGSGITPRNEY